MKKLQLFVGFLFIGLAVVLASIITPSLSGALPAFAICAAQTPVIGTLDSVTTQGDYSRISLNNVYEYDDKAFPSNRTDIDAYNKLATAYRQNNYRLPPNLQPSDGSQSRQDELWAIDSAALKTITYNRGDIVIVGRPGGGSCAQLGFTGFFGKDGIIQSAIADDSQYYDYAYGGETLSLGAGTGHDCINNGSSKTCTIPITYSVGNNSFVLNPGNSRSFSGSRFGQVALIHSTKTELSGNVFAEDFYPANQLHTITFQQGLPYVHDPVIVCALPGRDLTIGATDSYDGAVSFLQHYLIDKGFLMMPPGVSTGYFGNLTRQAVSSLQRSLGISPAAGYFGPVTRNYLLNHQCGNPVTQTVSLTSVSPSSGSIGTQVTVYGSGFTSTNNSIYLDNILTFGGIGSSDGHTLTFTVPTEEGLALPCLPPAISCGNNPTIIPGPLAIKVSNTNGTSNTLDFMVPSSEPPSPTGDQIIRTVGEREGSFLIKRINSGSVDGTYWVYQPVARADDPGAPRTLYVGDDVGLGCAGISDKITNIDSYNQTVTFNKVTGPAPYGGCPICLAGNTLIDTSSGKVAVKDMQVGMPIWTADKVGRRISGIVLKTSRVPVPPTHQMVHLILSDGRELLASPGHPTILGRGVEDLKINDIYDGASIVSAERVPYDQGATYDVLPSGETGFYWANDILLGSTLFDYSTNR